MVGRPVVEAKVLHPPGIGSVVGMGLSQHVGFEKVVMDGT